MFESSVTDYSKKLESLLKQPLYRFSDVSSQHVPEASGVYLIYSKSPNQIIYAGRSRNLRRRLLNDYKRGNIRGSQFWESLGQKYKLKPETEISDYIVANCSFRFLPVESFEETVRLEHFITAIMAPLLNTERKQ